MKAEGEEDSVDWNNDIYENRYPESIWTENH
jgi:hypothetical protein